VGNRHVGVVGWSTVKITSSFSSESRHVHAVFRRRQRNP